MDYRDFLGASEERVLPHLGGLRVVGPRPFRLEGSLQPGWYRFTLQGRRVKACVAAEPEEELLETLRPVRGHLVGTNLALVDGSARPLHLLPEWRPERFAPVLARVWGDALIFHREDFESESESEARAALDEGLGLGAAKGVPSSLRAAFALELLERASQSTGIAWQVAEALPHLRRLASEGSASAETWLREMEGLRQERIRQEERRRARETRSSLQTRHQRAPRGAPASLEDRVDRALHSAGGVLLDLRPLGDGLADVRWTQGDVTLLSMFRQDTLQVIDSGVCLEGSDDQLTLESLPGVIEEALRGGQLVITRRA